MSSRRPPLDMPWPHWSSAKFSWPWASLPIASGAVEGWLESSRSGSLVAAFDRKLGGGCSGPGGSKSRPAESA
jgi:hypothetical protein